MKKVICTIMLAGSVWSLSLAAEPLMRVDFNTSDGSPSLTNSGTLGGTGTLAASVAYSGQSAPSNGKGGAKFTLWQLPSQTPSPCPELDHQQMLSYVVQTADGKLIVVDGGNTDDGLYLKNFLADRGSHVDSWFITHTHRDHTDALSWILSNQDNLVIDEIYAAVPPSEWIQQYYDANTLEAYQTLTNALANVDRSYVNLNPGESGLIEIR